MEDVFSIVNIKFRVYGVELSMKYRTVQCNDIWHEGVWLDRSFR